MPLSLTEPEQEIVFLKAINELIDSMVNFEMMNLLGTDPDSNILFSTSTHQRFFNIALVDFLSRTDKKAPVQRSTYLSALRSISANPHFSVNDSVAALRAATSAFIDWLECKVAVDVWLASIGVQATVQLSRIDFLKMSGDIAKHNVLRSVGVAEELQEALKASGTPADLEAAMLALDDFYDRFHTDILNYHSSTVAEFLNNIRWGIFEYLQPEFNQSIVWESREPPKYRYTYPTAFASEFAKQCYWNLLNEVRSPPFMRKFQVTKWLKLRY